MDSQVDIGFDMFYCSCIKGNDPKVLAGGRFAFPEMSIQFGN